MAVTIEQTPDDYSLSGNPLIWIFSSNQTAQANFSFKVEIFVNATLKETHFVLPESGNKAHYDASDAAERYAEPPQTGNSQILDAENYISSLKLTVTENYGTPPSDKSSNNSSCKVIKGAQKKRDFLTYNPTDYVFGADKLWLTKFPRNEKRYINLDDINKFTYITNLQNLSGFVALYEEDGTPISQQNTGLAVRDEISITNISSKILLTNYGFSQANIDAIGYLEIWWDTGAIESEKLRLYVDNRCVDATAKSLVFLSTLGSLEVYRFTKRSQESARIKGKGYEGQFGYFNENGAWDYSLGGNIDYIKEIDNADKLMTDWIPQDEYNWLTKELLASPLVYLVESGNFFPVKVTNSRYQDKRNINDLIFNLMVDIDREKDYSTVI